jgi:surface protein
VIWMHSMFASASAFDQDISDWKVGNVINMSEMFSLVSLSTENYNNLLMSWSNQTLKPNVNFHAGNSQYSAIAVVAKQNMINNDGWVITDGGLE